MKNENKILKTVYWTVVLGICMALAIPVITNTTQEQKSRVEYRDTCMCDVDTFSINNLYRELLKQEVTQPEIVMKQAILETGRFTSYGFKTRNNIFGFYDARLKQYLRFDDWKECVTYMKNWQIRKYKGQDYYTFLKNLPYAEDPLYISKVKSIPINDYIPKRVQRTMLSSIALCK